MGELSGKVAIVTGASKGIGAAIALRFGEAGAAVAVNYSSDKDGADRIVEHIKRDGGKAVAIQANVSKSADVKRLFAETKAKLGAPFSRTISRGLRSFLRPINHLGRPANASQRLAVSGNWYKDKAAPAQAGAACLDA
jgi:NAD(P)-dependent dehydrogenase (short-subunit alcohol dehydrogenase family)